MSPRHQRRLTGLRRPARARPCPQPYRRSLRRPSAPVARARAVMPRPQDDRQPARSRGRRGPRRLPGYGGTRQRQAPLPPVARHPSHRRGYVGLRQSPCHSDQPGHREVRGLHCQRATAELAPRPRTHRDVAKVEVPLMGEWCVCGEWVQLVGGTQRLIISLPIMMQVHQRMAYVRVRASLG